jgi:hypothetical protein
VQRQSDSTAHAAQLLAALFSSNSGRWSVKPVNKINKQSALSPKKTTSKTNTPQKASTFSKNKAASFFREKPPRDTKGVFVTLSLTSSARSIGPG